jgi:hypothetical protein
MDCDRKGCTAAATHRFDLLPPAEGQELSEKLPALALCDKHLAEHKRNFKPHPDATVSAV